MIFTNGGVPLSGLYIDPFWNFSRKSRRTPFGISVPNGGLQKTILRAVFGKKWLSFSEDFLNILDF